MTEGKPIRTYRSQSRDATAGETRRRLVEAASGLLSEIDSLRAFSLEAVARRAGVTRLTVYNQFGSRMGLMEAVFDRTAEAGGLFQLPEVFAMADPHAALARVVAIFSGFWASAPPALARLHAAGEIDPLVGEAVRVRNERRRLGLSALVGRLVKAGEIAPERAGDLVDLLFALTSFAFHDQLRRDGRPAAAIAAMVEAQAKAAVALASDPRSAWP